MAGLENEQAAVRAEHDGAGVVAVGLASVELQARPVEVLDVPGESGAGEGEGVLERLGDAAEVITEGAGVATVAGGKHDETQRMGMSHEELPEAAGVDGERGPLLAVEHQAEGRASVGTGCRERPRMLRTRHRAASGGPREEDTPALGPR